MHCHAMHLRDAKTRDILSCLGDPSRFELVLRLLEREHCVSELAIAVGLSQSCTTRHLQALARQGVVHRQRDGKRVLFRLCLERPAVSELLDWATRSAAGGGANHHADGGSHGARYLGEKRAPVRAPARKPRAGAGERGKPAEPGSARGPSGQGEASSLREIASASSPAIAHEPADAREAGAAPDPAPAADPGGEPAQRPARRFQQLEDFLL
jgi:DNA-binding transcriptional ArsR family regulator